MGAIEHGGLLVHKIFSVSQSKLLFSLSTLSLLLLLLLHSEALVQSFCIVHNGLLKSSTSMFLLLNCIIATIIASSRKESRARGACETKLEENRQFSTIDGGGTNEVSEKIYVLPTAIDEGIKVSDDDREQQVNMISEGGERNREEADALVREGGEHNQEEGALIEGCGENHKQEEGALIGGSGENHKQEKEEGLVKAEVGDKHKHGEGGLNSGGNEAWSREGGNVAQEAQTAEEVWAAIVSNNNKGKSLKASDKHNGSNEDVGAFATALNAGGAVESTLAAANNRGEPTSSLADNLPQDAGGDEDGDAQELEELNRRAEEFIARVNHQMRLQRLESLQRHAAQKRRRPRPPRPYHCHHHPHQQQQHHHLQSLMPPPPAAGTRLLVG